MKLEDIEQFINLGGSISYPYKESFSEYMDTLKLYKSYISSKDKYILTGYSYHLEFDNLPEAFRIFNEYALSSKNIMYILKSLAEKNEINFIKFANEDGYGEYTAEVESKVKKFILDGN